LVLKKVSVKRGFERRDGNRRADVQGIEFHSIDDEMRNEE